MSQTPTAIFVYGTLQRGGERERCWPRRPVRVERATIRGQLHDLGPYPALLPGNDLIAGELWHIAAEDMELTLAELDAVEGFGQDDVDLYMRAIVDCQTEQGETVPAYTYFIANETQARQFPRVGPDADGVCRWRSGKG